MTDHPLPPTTDPLPPTLDPLPPAAAPRVSRRTLATTVTERIREGVHRGNFPPGHQFNEVELAAHLGVSRGPVRESLQLLVHEGLLERRPHRGVFVPFLTETDIVDIFYARLALETAAFKRVITSPRPPGLIETLDATVDAIAQAAAQDDWEAVGDLDLRFHTSVIEAAGSPRLSRMYSSLISETRLCLNIMADTHPARGDLLHEHRELTQLIAGDDVGAAIKTLTQHFDEATVTLRRRLRETQEQPPPPQLPHS
ncbi:GntR family transcriptional regulator [Streptomyces sp. NPDC058067]|uniref:GntR family transcriptional regulator n=1 Tax=Streptomyces sp. NPDC058067 TaxID=3346324 RepID=UPI0036E47B20